MIQEKLERASFDELFQIIVDNTIIINECSEVFKVKRAKRNNETIKKYLENKYTLKFI